MINEQETQSLSKVDPREFWDALTRAKGAIDGQETEALQWNRWSV